MKSYVLDTSVVIKWFSEHDEDDQEKALILREQILEGNCLITIPELLFYELANALKHNPRFDANDVRDAVNSVIDMHFDIKGMDLETMDTAIDIAFKFNVTVYDAYFLSLSQRENKPFLTADYRFAERVRRAKNIVRLMEL